MKNEDDTQMNQHNNNSESDREDDTKFEGRVQQNSGMGSWAQEGFTSKHISAEIVSNAPRKDLALKKINLHKQTSPFYVHRIQII